MRSSLLLILLISTSAFADGFAIPGPNDVPLFYTLTNQDPKYHDAAFKAQEAFFMQIGFTQQYNAFTSYVSQGATNRVTSLIDKDTPLDSKTVFFVLGTAYAAGVKKQINKSFRNPLVPGMTNTVSISPSSQSLGFSIPF